MVGRCLFLRSSSSKKSQLREGARLVALVMKQYSMKKILVLSVSHAKRQTEVCPNGGPNLPNIMEMLVICVKFAPVQPRIHPTHYLLILYFSQVQPSKLVVLKVKTFFG